MVAKLFDLRVIVVGFLLAAGIVLAAGQYNVHTNVVSDEFTDTSNYPHCDNGETFFLTHFVEWARGGRMVPGLDCRIAGVSAEIVAQWTEQELLDQGIDPMTATPAEIEQAKNTVLLRWANQILRR